MTITMRPWHQSATDLALLAELTQQLPESTHHLVDLPWRVAALTQSERDARIWQDEDGTPVAFAAWQWPWAALDLFLLPGEHEASIAADLLHWSTGRFAELDRERGWPLPYWMESREDDAPRLRFVAEQGYLLDDDFHLTLMEHPLAETLPEPVLPAGFTIRSLAGEAEVAAYVQLHRAAFDSTSMTEDWRRRTLHDPHYRPGLDLVAVAPDGSLAGFCVGWFHPELQIGQVEPLGVHPHFQRQGLGRSLLLALLQRFQALDARTVLVEPLSYDSVGISAYAAVGFQPRHKVIRKGKELAQHKASEESNK